LLPCLARHVTTDALLPACMVLFDWLSVWLIAVWRRFQHRQDICSARETSNYNTNKEYIALCGDNFLDLLDVWQIGYLPLNQNSTRAKPNTTQSKRP